MNGGTPTRRLRVAGCIPIAFFALHFEYHYRAGDAGHMLWMCHISNLLVGFGLLLDKKLLVRIGVLWLLPGLFVWLWTILGTEVLTVTSLLSHLGGLAVGLWALGHIRWGRLVHRRHTWWIALVVYLVAQRLCSWLTPPELNVNLAHFVREGWRPVTSSYSSFWALTTVLAAVSLYALERILSAVFPPQEAAQGGAR